MARRKSLQELTIKDNFMFGAVMLDQEIFRQVIERVLGIEIAYVEVDREKSIVYHPKYKGVRLDAYAKDENNTRYSIEMQVKSQRDIQKRARYYQSQMDMDILMDDGAHIIFLSTKGTNEGEISPELIEFLSYVNRPTDDEREEDDAFVRTLKETVRKVKVSREMGALFMTWEDMIQEEREEAAKEALEIGRAEGRAEGELTQLVSLIQKKLAKGKTIEQIADAIESNVDEVERLIKEYLKKDEE